jgi:glutamate synthase domain-containing protein 3
MSKLTDFQEKLLNDLRSEFDKLNVKNEKQSSGKRFSIETIQNCINEEEKFKEVITKHNLAMIETFKKVILNEFKAFKKEFGKVIDLEYNFCKYQSSKAESFEYFIDKNRKAPIVEQNSSEAIIYFVSKLKFIKYD